MLPSELEAVRNATARAFAAQVRRALDVARIQGWEFPSTCDVGVKVVRTDGNQVVIYARIDDVGEEQNITPKTTNEDIATAVDGLVDRWLSSKGTPVKK